MKPQLVIFDCDGVLIDSEPIANRVFRDQLGAAGLHLPLEEVMRTFVGNTRDGCIELAGRMLGRPLPDDFGARWDEALFDALQREVKPVDGVPELLGSMRLPYCVASNGQPDRMALSLQAAGLWRWVEGKLFTASEVARPKPAPDLFLHAARTLGAPPRECVVVEDTVTGVRAALAAGMRALGFVGSPHNHRDAMEALGVRTFGSMRELPALLEPA